MQTSAPAVKQGWLRAIIFLIAYIVLIIAGALLAGLINVKAFLPGNESINAFIVSIAINFIISLVLVFAFCKLVDRTSFASTGWRWKGFGRERFAGLVAGILLVTVIASVLWLMQLTQWFTTTADTANMLLVFTAMLIVAVGEELVFRGYILNNLAKSMNREIALLLSSLLFAGFHLLNPNFNLIAFINIFVAGLLLGINYIFTRNLWFGVFLHFSWNFFQGPVLGFKVSGLELPALLEQNLKGGVLITGGRFGLEASLLTTIVMVLSITVFYYTFQAKYKAPSVK
jgi:membrane protease YdiL (CAAX protease family)